MPQRTWSFLMPAQDHFFLKRTLTWLNVCFTDSGKILLCTLFVGGAIASPGLQISAYLFPCFVLPILIIAFGFSFFFRPRVTVTRQIITSPSAGEYMAYKIIVKNIGKKPLRKLAVFEGILPFGLYSSYNHEKTDNTFDYLRCAESATLRLVMHCKFRGIYQLSHLYVGSCFPVGVFRWPVRIQQLDKLTVYPHFISQTEFRIPFNRVYQPGGIAISSHIGSSNEFLNTREYRHGDRLKDIHWASYAKTGKLIVKEYVDEYFVRIGLFLDTEFSKGAEPHSFERRVSIAAGIADSIAKKEYIIDLFAAGEHLYHFQIGRALAHLENLLELLACLEFTPKVSLKKAQASVGQHTRKLSSMVIILKDWDTERWQFCRALEDLGINLRVIVVRDKPLTRSPDRKLIIVPVKKNEGLIF